ncbi:hypothetical protein [Nitriliruptor alkaliphilus]|uniref:hypothetical protein n=1 Tax=Nitriliruptor alkaliphilus TaxID=427918 RepID=UPI00069888F1|nr:hypothetical protein [Nitriliruptor alkaliphilus]
MSRPRIALVALAAALLVNTSVTVAGAAPGDDGGSALAEVRAATARFHHRATAEAAGYGFIPGLDHCFVADDPADGAMGYHLIDASRLDLDLDPLRPEALVYVPGPRGQLRLGAVEWIVPAEPWDAEHTHPPEVLGHHLHLNEALGVYVLHAWLFEPNPAGTFEDWNPRVSCPAP